MDIKHFFDPDTFTLTYLVLWSGFLLLYWSLGIPLGPGASYVYPVPAG